MKKNLFLITPKTYNGGAENVAARLSRHFSKHHQVTVLSFDSSRTDYEYAGVMIDLDCPKTGSILRRLVMLLKAVIKIRDLKLSAKPHVSISLIGHPNLANVFSRQGELCVVSVRTYMRRSPSVIKHFFQRLLVNKVYNRADKVVAICEGVRKDLIDYYGIEPTKIEVIYPYFDVADIQKKSQEPLTAEWKNIFEKPVIITAGRLTYDKGHWHLIKAFTLVKQVVPDANLVILGRGEMEERLKRLAECCGYSDDIHFLGYQDNPFKFIHAATVFAFPSLIEGFGNALGEALACGTPAVASDCNVGPREILSQDGDPHAKATEIEEYPAGMLVPPFDSSCDVESPNANEAEKLMSAALIRILEDKSLRNNMSLAASKRALYFDTGTVTKSWDALLKES